MGLDYRVRCCPDGLMTDRRRHVQVLDCTIRDGGLCNRWQFSHAMVRQTFQALSASGVDVMEIGYQHSVSGRVEANGPWRYCAEDDLRRVTEPSRMRVSCMLDVGSIEAHELRPASDSVVDILRVATYADDIERALDSPVLKIRWEPQNADGRAAPDWSLVKRIEELI